MDENKLKKMCQSALDISYSGVTISEFRALPTQKFDEESNKWIPDSHSLFIILKKSPVNYSDQNNNFIDGDRSYNSLENFLETLIGLECCVDFS